MLKRLLKNEKGLTLIELLAVVVILGIVAAIAIPSIGKIIEDSKKKAVISDALQVINAAKIAKAANPTETKFEADGDPKKFQMNMLIWILTWILQLKKRKKINQLRYHSMVEI